MRLGLASPLRVHGRGIQHRDQRSIRIVDGRGGAGEADMAGTEMLVAVHDDGPVLGDARAHSVGSLPRLAPIGTQPQSRLAEGLENRGVDFLVQDDAARVGQQQRTTRHGDMVVQPIDFRRCDLNEVLVPAAVFLESMPIENAGFERALRVERIIDHAAAPRGADRRTHHRVLRPVGSTTHESDHRSSVLGLYIIRHRGFPQAASPSSLVVLRPQEHRDVTLKCQMKQPENGATVASVSQHVALLAHIARAGRLY